MPKAIAVSATQEGAWKEQLALGEGGPWVRQSEAETKLAAAEAERDAAREWFQRAEEQCAKLEAENARLRAKVAMHESNNEQLARAANFNAALAIAEYREALMSDKDGMPKGRCANCLTWHPIGDMWAECTACFDETTANIRAKVVPPPPARTVTRAQYGRALDVLRDWIGLSDERRMQRIISALGLRVADDTEARDDA